MEEELKKIRAWIRRGNMKQFHAIISPKIAPDGYVAELSGDSLTCYRAFKPSGREGPVKKGAPPPGAAKQPAKLGKPQPKELVLSITREGTVLEIPLESANEEFVKLLASKLKD